MNAPSYVNGPSTVSLLGDTIGQNLRRTVEKHGDREALVVPYQQYSATYRELWEQTGVTARALLARGVKALNVPGGRRERGHRAEGDAVRERAHAVPRAHGPDGRVVEDDEPDARALEHVEPKATRHLCHTRQRLGTVSCSYVLMANRSVMPET